jgi:DNA-binding NarL/FixJ family response regulator
VLVSDEDEMCGSAGDSVRVVLVDNRVVVREGISALLEKHPDLEVVAQATTAHEMATLRVPPDVILTEIDLPGVDGAEVIRIFRKAFTSVGILVLTVVKDPAEVQRVLAAGADGYLLKTATPADLLFGIRAVANGETYLQPSLGVELARWRGAVADIGAASDRLSPKEEDTLRLLAWGHTNAEIAEISRVSLRTIETHRARVLQKLGLRTRAELVRYAQIAGLVDLSRA